MLLVSVLFGVFLCLVFLGMPVGYAMLPAIFIVLILGFDIPLTAVATSMVNGIDQWIWLTFPLFLLLGTLMNRSGVSDALINFSQEIFGRIPGCLSHVSVGSNVLMAGMSGSCTADAAATGAILIPSMKRAGYPKGYASMIICTSSLIGSLIPPSLALIIVAVLGHLSVLRLWLGGIVPGLVVGMGLMIAGYILAIRKGFPREEQPFSFKRTTRKCLIALPSLVLPVVILGGMRLGFFTPTEAGAVGVVYILVLGSVFYRKLNLKNLQEAAWEAIKLVGPVLWIISIAIAFGWITALLNIGGLVGEFMIGITHNSLYLLTLIVFLLLALGCIMEAIPVKLILYPILYPVAEAYGIDPIHFGVLFTYTLLIGQCTPPIGPTMFVTNAIGECSVREYLRDGWPLLILEFALLPLFMLFPQFVTWLPNLIMGPRG